MSEGPILQTVTPVTHALGDFKVNRALPAKTRTMVGPFIFVDEFGPARLPPGKGMDVRPHPHINLATVTYLFDGAIEHRDSIGSHAVIDPGAINLMTAGSGIVHSERSPQVVRPQGPSLYGMQTWLALPDGREEVAPAFDHVPAEELPLIEEHGARARVLMGTLWGATAGTRCDSPTIYADVEVDGGSIPIEKLVEAQGFDWFFDKTFGAHVDLSKIPEAEKRQYLADWSQPGAFNAMLNWYRASRVVVPPPGVSVPIPDWLLRAFPTVKVPTQVIWGMKDSALLPLQLDGLDELVEDLTIEKLPDAGHFAPWEAGDQIAAALAPFLVREPTASATPA